MHVHSIFCRRGFDLLNENGDILDGSQREVHFDKIRINHYFCKSLEEYTTIKMGRGDVFWGELQKKIPAFHAHDRNEFTDTEILSHI